MFIGDYGVWLELIDSAGLSDWISFNDLFSVDLKKIKLIYKHQFGKIQAKCWLTYNAKSLVLEKSFLVVDKEKKVNQAILEGLKQSAKFGGGYIMIGCLENN